MRGSLLPHRRGRFSHPEEERNSFGKTASNLQNGKRSFGNMVETTETAVEGRFTGERSGYCHGRRSGKMILWSVEKIRQMNALRVTMWAAAKFLLGAGLGMLLATYLRSHASESVLLISGWALVIIAVITGLLTIYPIFKR
jgi:hypothetical protein